MDKKFSKIQFISVILLFALCLVSILNIAEASMLVQRFHGLKFQSNEIISDVGHDCVILFELIFGIIGTILPLVLVYLISKDKIYAPKAFLVNLTYKFAELVILLGSVILQNKGMNKRMLENETYRKTFYRQWFAQYGTYMIIFGVLFIIALITLLLKKINEDKITNIVIILAAVAIGCVFTWIINNSMTISAKLDSITPAEILRTTYLQLSSLVILDATFIGSVIGYSLKK